MKCESVRAQLTAYLDGELPDERGSAVRGHLRVCDACRQIASDEAIVRDGLRALPPLDPPPSLWANVQARLAQEEVADAERPAWRRFFARWAPRAPHVGLAGLAVAVAIVLIVLRVQRDDDAGKRANDGQLVVAPEPTAPEPAPRPTPRDRDLGDADMTADVAAEPARVTTSYAQTARELFELATEVSAAWPEGKQRDFATEMAVLQAKIDGAKDERAKQAAYRAQIRYLQRASIHDDVALASIGGAP